MENNEEERSETEKALWDEIRADLSDEDAENAVPVPVISEEDEVEEIEEIQEENVVQADDAADLQGMTMANAFQTPASQMMAADFSIPEDELTDEVGIITGSMTVLGNIYSTGHMEIYGTVQGDVEVNGSLRILGILPET